MDIIIALSYIDEPMIHQIDSNSSDRRRDRSFVKFGAEARLENSVASVARAFA